MCIREEQQNIYLEEQPQEINGCQKYKYLAMHITNYGSLNEEISYRYNQGKEDIVWLNKIL